MSDLVMIPLDAIGAALAKARGSSSPATTLHAASWVFQSDPATMSASFPAARNRDAAALQQLQTGKHQHIQPDHNPPRPVERMPQWAGFDEQASGQRARKISGADGDQPSVVRSTGGKQNGL